MDREAWFAVIAVIIILVSAPATVVLAATLSHESTAGVTYVTNSGMEVTLTDSRTVTAVPFDGDQTYKDGNLTITGTGGEIGIGDQSYGGDPVTVSNVDTSSAINVTRSDMPRTFIIESGDAATLQVQNYTIDNGQADVAYSSNNGITMTFVGLPDVGVAAVDTSTGDILDDTVVGTDGKATLSMAGGTRNVALRSVASELQVRNEAKPDELVTDNVSLRARFFAEDDTVIERNVTNGTVSLDGIPADQEVVITVKEANADYTYRRILIENIVETREIYILPTTEPSAEIRFQLQDDTGRFDPTDTKLFVQKAITRNNNTEYRVISGDYFGSNAEFPTILIDSERYRLVVENDAGEKRVLGAYTVQGADVATLPIGEVEFEAEADGGPAMQASLRDADPAASHDHEARIVYVDPEGKTDSIDISITNESGVKIRPDVTESLNGSENIYVETYPLNTSFDPEEDSATVTIDADRTTGTETFEQVIGDVPEIFANAPIDVQVLEFIGYISILALMGLLVIVNPSMAALVGTGYAGLLSLLGVVPIPIPYIVVAGLVGILATVGTNGGIR